MPTIPWTATIVPAGETTVVCLATQLELRHARHVIGFLRASMQVRKQLLASPGSIGVSLRAEPMRRTFWTLSAWTNQSALDTFVTNRPHLDIMHAYGQRLANSVFTTWEAEPAVLADPTELWHHGRALLADKSSSNGR
jgi:hypothetical protein